MAKTIKKMFCYDADGFDDMYFNEDDLIKDAEEIGIVDNVKVNVYQYIKTMVLKAPKIVLEDE